MKPEGYVEIYRVAFDVANSELTEIGAEVEGCESGKNTSKNLLTFSSRSLPKRSGYRQPGFCRGRTARRSETGYGDANRGERRSGSVSWPIHFSVASTTCWESVRGIRDVRKYSRQF